MAPALLEVTGLDAEPTLPKTIDTKVPIVKETAVTTWKEIRNRRRREINKKVPREYLLPPHLLTSRNSSNLIRTSGLLSAREIDIVSPSATKLLEKIHSQEFTAVEVTRAFCKSSAVAHQAVRHYTFWIESNTSDIQELDQYMRVHKKPKGPLHGLPISVKEHICLAGTPSTSGFIAWADNMSDSDALIIQVLRKAGAIFHVKTTNPQGLMALETSSNLYGTTTNPFNSNLTPGGSSGGEAALIAMRGSLLGIGTDIGGSIRVPSAFCGIFGLKPSVAGLPHGGLSGAQAGMENIIGCVGPMATCVVLASEPWLQEPSLVELPWKTEVKTPKHLKIGIIYHDGVVHPHPPITRCLQQTVHAIERAGHEVVPWDTSLHRALVECIEKLYFLDAGKDFHSVFDKGNESPTVIMKWVLERVDTAPASITDSWKLNKFRDLLRTSYAAQWNAAGIDAILCSSNASVASVHNESTYWGYSSVFNILDLSAAVFPVGKVEATDSWENLPTTQDFWERRIRYIGNAGLMLVEGVRRDTVMRR
ncbi:putative amidase [Lachnellula suecica]|uniref:amidase n=1 Tax=Lachnellula suecica TaxID=602035 RepID=A0A8T9CHK8_9HELO|nr:putative amidase [Lachnellula suecica]